MDRQQSRITPLAIASRLTRSIFILSLYVATGTFNLVHAAEYQSPEEIEGITRIDAETLIEMARTYDELVIIDARIRSDRRQGYIAGSTSLPNTETDCDTLKKIIDRLSTPTVFYCNGPRCRRSDISVMTARECGYDNLFWFRGGIEEWKSKNYLISK